MKKTVHYFGESQHYKTGSMTTITGKEGIKINEEHLVFSIYDEEEKLFLPLSDVEKYLSAEEKRIYSGADLHNGVLLVSKLKQLHKEGTRFFSDGNFFARNPSYQASYSYNSGEEKGILTYHTNDCPESQMIHGEISGNHLHDDANITGLAQTSNWANSDGILPEVDALSENDFFFVALFDSYTTGTIFLIPADTPNFDLHNHSTPEGVISMEFEKFVTLYPNLGQAISNVKLEWDNL